MVPLTEKNNVKKIKEENYLFPVKNRINLIIYLSIFTGEKHPQIKLKPLQKVRIWTWGSWLNSPFLKTSYAQIKFSKEENVKW